MYIAGVMYSPVRVRMWFGVTDAISSVPEYVVRCEDGPAAQVDILELMKKEDSYWAEKKFKKITDDRLPNSGLIESE